MGSLSLTTNPEGVFATISSYFFDTYVKDPIHISLPGNMSFDRFNDNISYLYGKKHDKDIPRELLFRYHIKDYNQLSTALEEGFSLFPTSIINLILLYNHLSQQMQLETLFEIVDAVYNPRFLRASADDEARSIISDINNRGFNIFSLYP